MSVRLLGETLGINFNLKKLNFEEKEHLSPDRAISTYLAETYGKNDSIYPKDPKIRAQIARLQFFDSDTLFTRLYAYMSPVLMKGMKPDPKDLEKVHEGLKWLNSYLEGHFFAVGKSHHSRRFHTHSNNWHDEFY
ncbi:Glutathione S-transferase 1, isoform C [Armadillidium vulgare]|nr:Glutathione S-transferase 1, isoform C [Armadillidium vulgare]